MKVPKISLLLTFVFLIGCGDDKSSGGNPVVPDEPSSSIIAEPESSSNKEQSSSIKESSSSKAKSSSSKDNKHAETSSSGKAKSSSSLALSSSSLKGSSSSEEVSSSSGEEMESSSSSVKTSSSSQKSSSSSAKSSSSKPKSSSSSAKSSSSSAKSSSSRSKSSSSSKKIEESSSSERSSSSSKKIAEIKPNDYYKTNCPEGVSCKYVTTEFLNQELLAENKYGEILDERDGNVYKTIEIGTQTWIAQNMNYDTTGFCYDDVEDNCEKYGRLYDKNTANFVCPQGWILPDTSKWRILINFSQEYLNKEYAGSALKSENGGWWAYSQDDSKNICESAEDEGCVSGNGNNELGFSAIALGKKADEAGYDKFGKEFYARAQVGSFVIRYTGSLSNSYSYNYYLQAIRCLKDED